MIEEELSLLPRWCPDVQLPQPLAWYTARTIILPMKHRIEAEKLNVRAEYQWQICDHWCTSLLKR